MTKKILSSLNKICAMALILSACSFSAQANEEANKDDLTAKVAAELSGYHSKITTEQLENIAGGKDNLVSSLLKLRTMEKPPFVSIRSEKLLLNYASRADVAAALKSDIQDKNLRGLAGAIALHIDKIQDQEIRRSLAQMATSRAKEDTEFRSFVTGFGNSIDPEIRRLVVGN